MGRAGDERFSGSNGFVTLVSGFLAKRRCRNIMNDCSYGMTFEIRAAIEKHDLKTVKKLTAKCPAVLHHNAPHRWPIIHECMSSGCVDIELLELFLRTGGDVNRRTESGVSLAYLGSMLFERNDLVIFFQKNGARMSLYEEVIILMKGSTPQNREKQISKARGFLNSDPNLVHQVGDRGLTLLHYAVSQYAYEFVPMLLDFGSDPNKVTSIGQTPLGIFPGVNSSDDEACRQLLLRSGAFLSEREKMVEWILTGKNAEVMDLWDKAPNLINGFVYPRGHYLHIAAQCGTDSTLVEYLLQNKVSPNLPDEDFETPLHRASHRDCPTEPDKTKEIIKVLLKYGADINKASKEGNTPLHAFARRPWVNRVVFLVELGAELNPHNQDGQTALDIVYERRFPNYGRLASWLKSKGAARGNSKRPKNRVKEM